MMIDQRNNGASGTASAYTIDRWVYYSSQASKGTWQQNAGSVTPPVGFTNYLGFTSNSAYTILTTDQFLFIQKIEGYNVADLAWGTANAKTVTLSFQVYSSLTGTFGGSLQNSTSNRCYPFSYTVSSANTWTPVSITIAGDTSGTWLTTNGAGIIANFSLGTGATYSGTAGAWSGTSYLTSVTGAVSVVGTSGATFYITGVQLEKGTTATSFDYRPYGTELSLCYRYYRRYIGSGNMLGVGSFFNTTTVYRWGFQLDIPMRIAPTVSLNTCAGWGGNAVSGVASIATSYCTTNIIDADLSLASAMGSATGQTVVKVYLTGASPYVELNGAEL
jgi:hypothetical protein